MPELPGCGPSLLACMPAIEPAAGDDVWTRWLAALRTCDPEKRMRAAQSNILKARIYATGHSLEKVRRVQSLIADFALDVEVELAVRLLEPSVFDDFLNNEEAVRCRLAGIADPLVRDSKIRWLLTTSDPELAALLGDVEGSGSSSDDPGGFLSDSVAAAAVPGQVAGPCLPLLQDFNSDPDGACGIPPVVEGMPVVVEYPAQDLLVFPVGARSAPASDATSSGRSGQSDRLRIADM